jgi:hypothetical protein
MNTAILRQTRVSKSKMKNKTLFVLIVAIISLGIQQVIAASEISTHQENASKEVIVRTLGASKVASLIKENYSSVPKNGSVKKIPSAVQSKMRSIAQPENSAATTAPREKTEKQSGPANYLPYIIVLALAVVAAFFLYRARGK